MSKRRLRPAHLPISVWGGGAFVSVAAVDFTPTTKEDR
jgi:hypothetical protein